jgi:hypothetical protein
MYPAILSCRRPEVQLVRLSGAALPTPKQRVSCQSGMKPIQTFGEQKAGFVHS